MVDRRDRRRSGTTADIVAAAWQLAAEKGLGGLTLRDLARKVGMQAPSLYSYFDSKAAIYDAMFVEGNQALLAALRGWETNGVADPHRAARAFVDFCTDDPVRYQLLFQRVLPRWEPSPDAYHVAQEVYALMRGQLARLGVEGDRALDLWTAVLAGLTDQQISNDPGGDRWTRLVDEAVDMLLAHTREGDR